MNQFERLQGLIAAPFTPMNADGSVALDRIEQVAAHLVQTGVKGAFVCGTTGESLSLTVDERMKIAARWMDVSSGRIKIIVHVGDNSQMNSIALAVHAQKIGAAAISAMPTCFFKPADVKSALDWIAPVAAAAPGVPFYYYHIPSMTGVSISMEKLLQAASRMNIPTFHGIKFTHYDLPEYQQCLNVDDGRYDISFGRDEALLGAVAMGAKSAVGSTYNYSAAIYLKMIKAFQAGDVAQAQLWSYRAIQAIDILCKYGGLRCGKAIMSLIGLDLGPVRAPLSTLSDQEKTSLRTDLEQVGFFEWIKP